MDSSPTATLKSNQALTDSRQSIRVQAHTGQANATVFFLWAYDAATSNKLELKIDDSGPNVVAGYIIGGKYTFVADVPYEPGSDGLYMAFRETNGTTFWEISTDANNWTEVASASDPVATGNMVFQLKHQAYNPTAAPTFTEVGCFNYMLHGVSYLSLEDKTNGWSLYTEGFNGGKRVCCSDSSACGTSSCNTDVNNVDSSQHFTDTSIPAPYTNQDGYNFEIISTEEPTTHDFYNAYRYQKLPFVDADQWTYHLYFKYAYPEFILQGLEFPVNKYTGSRRLQGAVAWYPKQDGTDNGEWNIWGGPVGNRNWIPTGFTQALQTNFWYEVTFTVGLHDNQVFYNGFKAGLAGNLTSFTWNQTYATTNDTTSATILPAVQIDDDTKDTTTAGTQKNCYMAEWHITSMYQRLP